MLLALLFVNQVLSQDTEKMAEALSRGDTASAVQILKRSNWSSENRIERIKVETKKGAVVFTQLSMKAHPAASKVADLKPGTTALILKNSSELENSEVFNHSQLEILWIKNAKSLPVQISRLRNLKAIFIDAGDLAELPEEITQLTRLEVLSIKGTSITSLPPEIGNLKRLVYLNLENNHLESLPESIGRMTRLKYLEIESYSLTALPSSIGDAVSLESIIVNKTQISEIPSSIGKLKSLKWLNFSNSTKLNKLPVSMQNLSALKGLNLYLCNISSIDFSLCGLKNLKYLDVSTNNLFTLPDCLSDLDSLRELRISSNNLTVLPNGLNKLKHLEVLDVSNNYLYSIPPDISNLPELFYLDLSVNLFQKVPDSLWNLPKIQSIALAENIIKTIPDNLEKYSNRETKLLLGENSWTYADINKIYKIRDSLNVKINIDRQKDHIEFAEIQANKDLESIPKWRENIKNYPYNAFSFYESLAMIQLKLGKFDEALASLDSSHQLEPNHPLPTRPLTLLLLNQYEIAEKEYLKIITTSQQDARKTLLLDIRKTALCGVIPEERWKDIEKVFKLIRLYKRE